MLGAIIGDIVGSRFEFHNHKSKNFELFTEDCRFTDDTVMTLAVAKAIQESKPDYSDLEEMAVKYMRQIGGHYPFCGYGGRFFHWMVCDDPKPYKSYGNGAAMRISACAEIPEADWETGFAWAKERARKVTKVTHNHREGLKGAEAVAVAAFMARAGVTKEDIKAYMDANYYKVDFTLDKIRSKYKFDVTCQGSVPQALAAFYESTDFEDAIRNAISIGGDSDTIAAITGAIAEQYYGIPARLQQIALSYLDDRLLDLYEGFQEFRGIKYIDPESLEDGMVLCGLKQMFLDDVSVETFNPLAACLRDSIVKVPGNAIVSEADMQRFREGIKGGIGATFSNEDVITFEPDIFHDEQGSTYFPMFCNEEQMPDDYRDHFTIKDMTVIQCIEMARKKNTTGLVLDPFTDTLEISPEFAQNIEVCYSSIKTGDDHRELKTDVKITVDGLSDEEFDDLIESADKGGTKYVQ